jgi:hypothetical protein
MIRDRPQGPTPRSFATRTIRLFGYGALAVVLVLYLTAP